MWTIVFSSKEPKLVLPPHRTKINENLTHLLIFFWRRPSAFFFCTYTVLSVCSVGRDQRRGILTIHGKPLSLPNLSLSDRVRQSHANCLQNLVEKAKMSEAFRFLHGVFAILKILQFWFNFVQLFHASGSCVELKWKSFFCSCKTGKICKVQENSFHANFIFNKFRKIQKQTFCFNSIIRKRKSSV
jgi:hypothetical protein